MITKHIGKPSAGFKRMLADWNLIDKIENRNKINEKEDGK